VGSFEQALGALGHLPERHDSREQAIDLRLALRNALFPSGDLGRILAYLREAEALAAALDDPRRMGQVSLFLSNCFRHLGEHDQAIAAARRALAVATAGGEVVQQALASYYLGRAYHIQGDYRQAIDYLGQTLASFEGARRHEHFGLPFLPAVSSRAYLAVCHAELGTFAEGRAFGDEGLRIAETATHPVSLIFACGGIGVLALHQGELSRALPLLEQAVSICREANLPVYFPWAAGALGSAYSLAGRITDAVPLLTQALEQTSAMETVGFQTQCRLYLGEAQVLAGRMEEAHPLAERTPVRARNAATRRMPSASSGRSPRGVSLRISSKPKPTTARL
jgi:tetratricopeptide (TPR) repeat protein